VNEISDWIDELSPEEREGWDSFVNHVRRETVQGMAKSAFVMSLVPSKENVDVKFAVELGLAIMMDKPILAIVMPDGEISDRLALVADMIVRADIDTEEGQREVASKIQEFVRAQEG